MRRSKSSCSIYIDVCLRVPKRSSSTTIIDKTTNLSSAPSKPYEESRRIFEQYAKRSNLSPADWYQLSSSSLDARIQQIVSKKFGGTLYAALSTIFPEIEWKAWKFQHHRVPKHFWKEQSNQRKFFEDLGQTLGIQTLDDWYAKLSKKELEKHGGASIAQNTGAITALMEAYPEHNWIPWKFNSVPPGFWDDKPMQKRFFEELGKKLGVEKMDDWYSKLSVDVVVKNGGYGLLNKYKNSPMAALMASYPEHNWIVWKFNTVPHGFWKDNTNQRKFFDDLGKKLDIEKMDDWYSKLSKDAIIKHGGHGLLNRFNTSPIAALKAAYPEHDWVTWKFKMVPMRFWSSKDNVRQFLNDLSEKLSIQTLDDWYLVSVELLSQFGAYGLLVRYKGLYNLLKEQYPQHPWDLNRFNQKGKKTQRWLAVTLKKMFPNEEILEDYLHPKAVFPTSKQPIQLDIYLPSRSIAFEYQGVQHYQDIKIFTPAIGNQQRDEEKRAVCAANNIKLVEVPYWWNRTQTQLREIIDKNGLSLDAV